MTDPTGIHPLHKLLGRFSSALGRGWRRLSREPSSGVPPTWHPRMTAWLLAGLAAALAAGLIDPVLIEAVRQSPNIVTRLMARITDVGKSEWYLVPAILAFCLLALMDWTPHPPRTKARLFLLFGQAAFVFSSVALAGIFTNIIKVLFGRSRPKLFDEVGAWHFDPLSFGYLHASFPSGHSTTVGAVTGILILWFPHWTPAFLAGGLFIAATRVPAFAHYPSDVVTGLTIGTLFSIAIARWLARRGVVFRFVPDHVLPEPILPGGRRQSVPR